MDISYDISEKLIKDNTDTDFFARNICVYSQISSTNTMAKQNCDMPDGTLFVADSQTNGRGRLGREWISPHGKDIFMSILLKPKIPIDKTAQITLAAGLGVCRALSEFCGIKAKIKWPNDIVTGTKKLCGIITELSFDKNGESYVVVGIGINVNSEKFDDLIKDKATSLKNATGTHYNRYEIISKVMTEIERYYKLFIENGFAAFRDEYKKMCANIGKDVVIIKDKQSVQGFCDDISQNGELIVIINGEKVTVQSGEVSVRGLYGYI